MHTGRGSYNRKSQTIYIQRGHAHTCRKNYPRGGLSERMRVRRHYGPLCSTLVAATKG